MHRTAKFGIAAHWRYKEGGKQAKDAADMVWLGQMMEWLKDMADPREFMEGLKIDLYGGQVFVFTPKGDVVNLPAGATPVDFAYAIHTDVGHRTIGAKVGASSCRSTTSSRPATPSTSSPPRRRARGRRQDWLQFVKTPRARTKIRQWFSRGRREDALEHGRDAVQRLMRKAAPALQAARHREPRSPRSPTELKYPNLEALYVAVGEGHVSPQSVVARLARWSRATTDEDVDRGPARATGPARAGRRLDRASSSAGSATCGFGWAGAARRCPATRSSGSSPGAKGSACIAPTVRT